MTHNSEYQSSKPEQLCDLIQQLHDNGTLKILYKAGFISSKALLYFEIYNCVKSQITKTKYKKVNVIFHEVAIKYNVSSQTVYRAWKIFYQKSEKTLSK